MNRKYLAYFAAGGAATSLLAWLATSPYFLGGLLVRALGPVNFPGIFMFLSAVQMLALFAAVFLLAAAMILPESGRSSFASHSRFDRHDPDDRVTRLPARR